MEVHFGAEVGPQATLRYSRSHRKSVILLEVGPRNTQNENTENYMNIYLVVIYIRVITGV